MSDVAVRERPAPVTPQPREVRPGRSNGDRVFWAVARGAALSVLLLLGLVLVFLCTEAWPALRQAGWSFFTTFEWSPEGDPAKFGIGSVLTGTVTIALVALVAALPVAIGSALFINEYAPRRLQKPLTSLLDLLAAVPSLIYGMWGAYWLMPRIDGTTRWVTDHLGFIPFFDTDRDFFGRSIFMCGLIVGLMILPIIASVAREVLSQTPRVRCEAALALGGTRWGMIRAVILPFGRSGLVGAAMLGLGRAMGETIAVALILSIDFRVTNQILSPGGGSVAGLIANNFGDAGPSGRSALIAAGLALFVVTLLVNLGARVIVNRARKGPAE